MGRRVTKKTKTRDVTATEMQLLLDNAARDVHTELDKRYVTRAELAVISTRQAMEVNHALKAKLGKDEFNNFVMAHTKRHERFTTDILTITNNKLDKDQLHLTFQAHNNAYHKPEPVPVPENETSVAKTGEPTREVDPAVNCAYVGQCVKKALYRITGIRYYSQPGYVLEIEVTWRIPATIRCRFIGDKVEIVFNRRGGPVLGAECFSDMGAAIAEITGLTMFYAMKSE